MNNFLKRLSERRISTNSHCHTKTTRSNLLSFAHALISPHNIIMCRDPELEASFSFSSFVLSDDEEEGYIEIALEDGLELRVSFSSCSVPLTGLSRTTTVDSSCFDDSAFSTPSSTTNCSRQQPSSTPIKRKLNRLFDSLVSSLRYSFYLFWQWHP